MTFAKMAVPKLCFFFSFDKQRCGQKYFIHRWIVVHLIVEVKSVDKQFVFVSQLTTYFVVILCLFNLIA